MNTYMEYCAYVIRYTENLSFFVLFCETTCNHKYETHCDKTFFLISFRIQAYKYIGIDKDIKTITILPYVRIHTEKRFVNKPYMLKIVRMNICLSIDYTLCIY